MKPIPLSEETLSRLERYGQTVISKSCFEYYDCDCGKVEKALEEAGFERCRCQISSIEVSDLLRKKSYGKSIIIEGKRINY